MPLSGAPASASVPCSTSRHATGCPLAIRVDYEPPGALHSVSRNAGGDVPASLISVFMAGDGESATVYDRL